LDINLIDEENWVSQTTNFILFTLIATLIIFTLVISNRSVNTAKKMARGFYLLCLFLSMAALITTVLSVSGLLPVNDTYRLLFRGLIYRGWVVIGTGISAALLLLLNAFGYLRSRAMGEGLQSFTSSPYVLKGLCLSVSVSFLATEIGKLTHGAEMQQFFLESGYAAWFLYFIIAAEILGAIGLFISKMIVAAASGLAIIMFGAIYTHYRNGDPFSDSLEALHLLILLFCITTISLLRRKVPDGFQ
jgi:uncharacterized membrane protein YphA (DoxX/SURF4 family)